MNPNTIARGFFNVLLRLIPIPSDGLGSPVAESLTLRELPVGGRGQVVGFDLSPENSLRLLEMGLTTGTWLQVVRLAPLGDPIEIKVRGYHLSLRREEAAGIRIVTEAAS
jgi:Fe2+ transport system protein FeoA